MLSVINNYAQYSNADCRYAMYHYVKCLYAECGYVECHYAECHYAERHYADCHYAECCGSFAKGHLFMGSSLMIPLGRQSSFWCHDILSTSHCANLSFCLFATLSNCHFVYLPFCLLAILSTCHFVNLPFCHFKKVYIIWPRRKGHLTRLLPFHLNKQGLILIYTFWKYHESNKFYLICLYLAFLYNFVQFSKQPTKCFWQIL